MIVMIMMKKVVHLGSNYNNQMEEDSKTTGNDDK